MHSGGHHSFDLYAAFVSERISLFRSGGFFEQAITAYHHV
jgi:hypothetical protein